MTDPFVQRIKRTRNDQRKMVSGRMVETRSQKTSEEKKGMLEVEVHPDQAMHDNEEMHGLEGRGRRLASESTPVEQGQDLATSTGTLDRAEMSELSDISTEVVATRRSPTDNTMMADTTEKQTTSSSFTERMKNTFGNIFPFTMGTGTGKEGESQEEEEDDDEQVDSGSQLSLNSSTQENDPYLVEETGNKDKFGVVRTISKEVNTPGQSRGFAIMTKPVQRDRENRNTGLGDALADPEVDSEKTSRQRMKARISTSTKLPGTDRVTSPLEEMNRNRQAVDRSEKRLRERTDEYIAKNLSRMTREAEQRESRLRDDMEKLRTQQEQTLGTLDTKLEAMMERRTHAIMDRLDGLIGSRSGTREGEPNSGGPSREPKVNFNDHQRRRADGSTRGRGSSSGYTTRDHRTWGPNSRASSTGNRQTSNERPPQGTHATGSGDSRNRRNASPGGSHGHVGQGKHSRRYE